MIDLSSCAHQVALCFFVDKWSAAGKAPPASFIATEKVHRPSASLLLASGTKVDSGKDGIISAGGRTRQMTITSSGIVPKCPCCNDMILLLASVPRPAKISPAFRVSDGVPPLLHRRTWRFWSW